MYIGVNSYGASNALLAYTDSVTPSYVNGYARFTRPINDAGSDYQYSMPGGRLRFRSDAKVVNVLLRYNGLVTRTDARNLLGALYIDGAYVSNFVTPQAVNVVTLGRLNIVNATAVDRLYELVLPFADGVEFRGVEVDKPYVVTAAAARTGRLMVSYGDSITQGFFGTETRFGYPYLLAAAKGFRCINMGYGGRTAIAADGTAIANLSPDLITIMIGYNDFSAQTAVATYKANLKSLITNIHNINATVPIYVTAPVDTLTSLTIPMSSYQAQVGTALTELGFSQTIGVDKSTLITNTATQLNADGIHPNNTGHAQIASGFGAVVI